MAISNTLQLAKNTQTRDLPKSYRNRLMHHVRPSVDYAMFYAYVNSRFGKKIRDQQGNLIGRRRSVLRCRFEELHEAFEEDVTSIVALLRALSEIELLRTVSHPWIVEDLG